MYALSDPIMEVGGGSEPFISPLLSPGQLNTLATFRTVAIQNTSASLKGLNASTNPCTPCWMVLLPS